MTRVSRYFVKDRLGVMRKLPAMKRPGKDRPETGKLAQQAEDLIEIFRKEFASSAALLFVARVDRQHVALCSEEQDYFRHAPSASFRFTSSHATTRLGSRR